MDLPSFFTDTGFQDNSPLVYFYLFIYATACAIFLPTPSEAPIFLYPKFPMTFILIISALGKGIGACIVCEWWELLDTLLIRFKLRRLTFRKDRLERYIQKWGFWAYFFTQAVPFMPMRTAIYVYSYLGRNTSLVGLGAGIGTVIRMLFMYGIVWLGYLSIKSIMPQ